MEALGFIGFSLGYGGGDVVTKDAFIACRPKLNPQT